jgi:hypothetical protein
MVNDNDLWCQVDQHLCCAVFFPLVYFYRKTEMRLDCSLYSYVYEHADFAIRGHPYTTSRPVRYTRLLSCVHVGVQQQVA